MENVYPRDSGCLPSGYPRLWETFTLGDKICIEGCKVIENVDPR